MQLRQWPHLLLAVANIASGRVSGRTATFVDAPACLEEERADQQLQGPTRIFAQQVVPADAAAKAPKRPGLTLYTSSRLVHPVDIPISSPKSRLK